MKKRFFILFMFFLMVPIIDPGISISEPMKWNPPIETVYTLDELSNIETFLKLEVDAYIKRYASTSKLSADILVNVCQSYDLNIMFALSQAHVESHFGTVGIASRTNSVFNVGTFDDGTILYRYNDPNRSIEPYARLISTRYLVDDKTVCDLLKPRSFVNYRGKRYASHKQYEYMVRNIYNRIKKETDIDSLQMLYYGEKYVRSQRFYVMIDNLNDTFIKNFGSNPSYKIKNETSRKI